MMLLSKARFILLLMPLCKIVAKEVSAAAAPMAQGSNKIILSKMTSALLRRLPPTDNTILVKEIVNVRIKSSDIGACDILRESNTADRDLYVTFRYANTPLTKSTYMTKPKGWKPDHLLRGLVQDNFEIDTKEQHMLVCEVKRARNRFWRRIFLMNAFLEAMYNMLFPKKYHRDRTIAIAEFTEDDIEIKEEEHTIKVGLRNSKKGKGVTSLTSFLEIDLRQRRWSDVYSSENLHLNGGKEEKFFRNTSAGFRYLIEGELSKNPTATHLQTPTKEARPLKMEKPLKGLDILTFPNNDEFFPVPFYISFMLNIMNFLCPPKDTCTFYKNRSDGIAEIRQTLGNNFPDGPPEGDWGDVTCDASMTRVYFASTGMFLVQKAPGFKNGYVADISNLTKYKVRPNRDYVPFGSKTYFDERGDITKIEDHEGKEYRPGDPFWQWAKLKSRTDAFTQNALNHLCQVHFFWGNFPGTAVRQYLPPKHPFRKAFTPHFFKSHYNCRLSQPTLFQEKGLLSRTLSMDYKGGFKDVWMDFCQAFKFERYPDEIRRQGVQNCKFHVGAVDGIELHKIMCDYVSNLIDEIYSDETEFEQDTAMRKVHDYLVKYLSITTEAEYTMENAKTIWGEIFFRVSGYHSAVGAVLIWSLDPSMANVRLRKKEVENEYLVSPKESSKGLSLIGALTQVAAPRLSEDWGHMLEDPFCKSYSKLRKDLDKLAERIDTRNGVRDSYVAFHPSYCTLSISS